MASSGVLLALKHIATMVQAGCREVERSYVRHERACIFHFPRFGTGTLKVGCLKPSHARCSCSCSSRAWTCTCACVLVCVRLRQQLPTSVHVLSKDPVLGDNVMSVEHVGAEKDMDTMVVRREIMEVLHDLSEDERTIVTLR